MATKISYPHGLVITEHNGVLTAEWKRSMKDIQLTKHFALSEFVKQGEQPTDTEIGHLRLLCTYLLEPLRQAWNSGITVTSGYRSPERNAAVGGSKTSAHCLGYAADIVPANGKMAEFKHFIKSWLTNASISAIDYYPFDQCIDERNASGAEWVHLGLMNGKGEMRRQFLITTDGKTYKEDKV